MRDKKQCLRPLLLLLLLSNIWVNITYSQTLPVSKTGNYTLVKDGVLSLYTKESRYYLGVDREVLGQDILIVGDAAPVSGIFAASSGMYRFLEGINRTSILVKKLLPVDTALYANDLGAVASVSASNLLPTEQSLEISFVDSARHRLLVDITDLLLAGGKLFSFSNFVYLNNPDKTLSQLLDTRVTPQGITFSVYRSQLNALAEHSPRVSAYNTTLSFYIVNNDQYKIKFEDPRIGFRTLAFVDFSKDKYYAHSVKAVQRWNIFPSLNEKVQYDNGTKVVPAEPIIVEMEDVIPQHYQEDIAHAVADWNKAFEQAGFQNAIQVKVVKNTIPTPGKIIIRWGNANGSKPPVSVITDPRTGRIYLAKMNLSAQLVNALKPFYFAQCGLVDTSAFADSKGKLQDLLMQYVVTKTMGEILGMKNNYAASNAFKLSEISDGDFVQKNGFTSSVTDAIDFNYAADKKRKWASELLIPRVGIYDRFAIQWGYGSGKREVSESDFVSNGKAFSRINYIDTMKDNTLGLWYDLSSERVDAAKQGIENIIALYPTLDHNYVTQNSQKENWTDYMDYSNAFFNLYQRYIGVFTYEIGGVKELPLIKGYNSKMNNSNPIQQQRLAMDYLGKYLFTSEPKWLNSSTRFQMVGNNVNDMIAQVLSRTFKKLLSNPTMDNIVQGANLNKNYWTVEEYLGAINHWVFDDFNVNRPATEYKKWVQLLYLNELIQVANENKINFGLTTYNSIVYKYMQSVIQKVKLLAAKHTDKNTRENYDFLTIMINNNYTVK